MIDFIIVGIYLLSILLVGFYFSRRIKTAKEYAIANQDYPTPVIVAAISATIIGGASTIGVAERFFSVGLIFIFVCLAVVIRDILTAHLIVPRLGDLTGIVSSGDLMAQYFGQSGRVLTGIATLSRCIALTGTQICAIGLIGNYFLDLSYVTCAVGAGIIVIFYSSLGGIRSVTITDVIQFGVLIVAIPLVCSFSISSVGGLGTLMQSLPQSHTFSSLEPDVIWKHFGLVLMFMLPEFSPAVIQRILMGKSLAQLRTSITITAAVSIPIYLLIGLIALATLVKAPDTDPNLAFLYLVNEALPIGFRGIAISGILAITMSTADSDINLCSIAMVKDIICPLWKKPISDQAQLRLMRFASILTGTISIFCALVLPNVFSLAVASLAIWKPVIFPPMLMGILGLLKSQRHFFIGIVISFLTLVFWNMYLKSQLLLDGILIASIVHFAVLLCPHLARKAAFIWQKQKASFG